MSAPNSVILCFDIGSSSIRCTPYSRTGEAGHDLQCPIELAGKAASRGNHLSELGHCDARMMLQAAGECLDEVTVGLGDDCTVSAIAFASMSMTWIGVDSNSSPVTPVYTYAHHSEHSKAAITELRSRLGGKQASAQLRNETGVPLHSSYAPAILLEVESTQPELLEKVDCWQSVGSWILSQWTGQRRTPISVSEASWAGLLDIHDCKWHPNLVEVLPLKSGATLPAVVDWSECELRLDPAHLERWPCLQAARIYLPVGDGAAANIGSACLGPSSVAVTIGTSAAVRVTLPGGPPEVIPAGLWCYRVDRSRVVLGGSLTDGGSLVAWVRQIMGLMDDRAFERAAAQAQGSPPASHGLTVLPFLGPERSTGFNPDVSGVLHGLTHSTQQSHILQAYLEAIALRLKAIYERIRPFLTEKHSIVASGGALEKSGCWRQMISDATGVELALGPAKATSAGVAFLVCGTHDPEHILGASLTESPARCYPDSKLLPLYDQELKKQEGLYQRTFGSFE